MKHHILRAHKVKPLSLWHVSLFDDTAAVLESGKCKRFPLDIISKLRECGLRPIFSSYSSRNSAAPCLISDFLCLCCLGLRSSKCFPANEDEINLAVFSLTACHCKLATPCILITLASMHINYIQYDSPHSGNNVMGFFLNGSLEILLLRVVLTLEILAASALALTHKSIALQWQVLVPTLVKSLE